MPEIDVKRDGAVGRVIVSNPAKLNAMSLEMWQAIPKAMAELDDDPNVRCLIVEGEGDKAFISGANISLFDKQRTDPKALDLYDAAVEAAYAAPIACSKPVIAKIVGVCMGGGLGLAAACDLRFCRDDARFRMPASRLGVGYGVGGVNRFLSVIGLQNTLDIFFSARIFDAGEAQRMGFVSKVAPRETFDQMVEEWCAQVVENAPLTLWALKKAANHLLPGIDPHDLAEVNAAIAACHDSADYREGVLAFTEKRQPRFRGS